MTAYELNKLSNNFLGYYLSDLTDEFDNKYPDLNFEMEDYHWDMLKELFVEDLKNEVSSMLDSQFVDYDKQYHCGYITKFCNRFASEKISIWKEGVFTEYNTDLESDAKEFEREKISDIGSQIEYEYVSNPIAKARGLQEPFTD